jgi:dTDP-4-dehydrorhamnose reductase
MSALRRVAITGVAGRLGAALARAWAGRFEVVGFDRASIDLSVPGRAGEVLAGAGFDVLVHCAAQTNVDRCETHPEEARRINAEATGEIAAACAAKGARLVAIGTDYVFDGTKPEPYTEEDEPRPISAYGWSKLEGERAALAADARNIVARVSWVFGPDRPSFVDQIVRRATAEERVDAIGDKLSSPAYTADLARYLEPFVDGRCAEGGIVHLCNRGATSWREYGQRALDVAARAGVPLRATRVGSLRMADLEAFIASRPVQSAMAVDKAERLTGISIRPWEAAVEDYLLRGGGLKPWGIG